MSSTPPRPPLRRQPALASLALAVALLLGMLPTAIAQGSEADRGLLDLVERFIDPWRDPQVSQLLLLPGAVPEAVPALPDFAGGSLVGSLTRFEDGWATSSTLLYDFEAPPEQAFTAVQNQLREAGWAMRVEEGALGFLSSQPFLYGQACLHLGEEEQGWAAFLSATRGLDGYLSQLRVELSPMFDPGFCEPYVEPWRAEQVPLPLLPAPSGATVSSTTWNQSDGESTSSAVLRDAGRSLNEVMSYYAGQLGAGGWTPLGAAAVPHANGSASRWRYTDERGSWIGLLSVGRTVEAGDQAVEAPIALLFVVVPSP